MIAASRLRRVDCGESIAASHGTSVTNKSFHQSDSGESCHRYHEWVMSRMSHVMNVNESSLICEWGMAWREGMPWRVDAKALRRACEGIVASLSPKRGCISRVWLIEASCHTRMRHITHMRESCRTRLSRTCTSHVTRGHHAHAQVMSHEAITHMHESCHTRLWRTCTSHVTRGYDARARVMSQELCHTGMRHIIHMHELCPTCLWVMSHCEEISKGSGWMSHVTNDLGVNYSRHTCEWVMSQCKGSGTSSKRGGDSQETRFHQLLWPSGFAVCCGVLQWCSMLRCVAMSWR